MADGSGWEWRRGDTARDQKTRSRGSVGSVGVAGKLFAEGTRACQRWLNGLATVPVSQWQCKHYFGERVWSRTNYYDKSHKIKGLRRDAACCIIRLRNSSPECPKGAGVLLEDDAGTRTRKDGTKMDAAELYVSTLDLCDRCGRIVEQGALSGPCEECGMRVCGLVDCECRCPVWEAS